MKKKDKKGFSSNLNKELKLKDWLKNSDWSKKLKEKPNNKGYSKKLKEKLNQSDRLINLLCVCKKSRPDLICKNKLKNSRKNNSKLRRWSASNKDRLPKLLKKNDWKESDKSKREF